MPTVLEFKLPDLGEGLTEAVIVRWLVQVGEVVSVDQPVVEVETAKALVDVPCPYGGVVTARFGEEGAELPVGAPLMTVAVAPAPESASGPAAGPASAGASGNVLVGYGTAAPAARRRRVRPVPVPAAAPVSAPARTVPDALAARVSPVAPAAPASPAAQCAAGVRTAGGVPTAEDVRAAAGAPVPVISPLVRRLARQHGLDLRELAGSGPDGLILRSDVESVIGKGPTTADGYAATSTVGVSEPAAGPASEPASGPAAGPASEPAAGPLRAGAAGERIALRGVRGAVADKMARSRTEIPDATCWVDADATELMAARTAMNATAGPKVSVLALLARICVAALAKYPELNSTVDTAAREVVRLPSVHLGFAAQTDRGLVVPVVRDAHTRSVDSLAAELGRLTELSRGGKLTPAELTGGTFTLNNYGVFGVDGSTPIINHPEAAMLGVGRIVPRPWVHEGELAVRHVVQLSLTFDHRVCDGGTAGGFLRYVADCVERPAVLLRTL